MKTRDSAIQQTFGPVFAIVVGCIISVGGFTSPAEARLTKLVITRVESPTFEGTVFGDVGPYEKIGPRARQASCSEKRLPTYCLARALPSDVLWLSAPKPINYQYNVNTQACNAAR